MLSHWLYTLVLEGGRKWSNSQLEALAFVRWAVWDNTRYFAASASVRASHPHARAVCAVVHPSCSAAQNCPPSLLLECSQGRFLSGWS